MNIENKVLEIIKTSTGKDASLDSSFDGLEIDSLSAIELMLDIEQEFGVEYPTDAEPPKTIIDVVTFLKGRLDN